jgi:hypothetical protein
MAPRRADSGQGKTINSRKLSLKAIAKAEKPARLMKPIFFGKTMSISGDFGEGWSHEDMSRWIKLHGGQYEKEVTEETTHLICTIDDYTKKTSQGMFHPNRSYMLLHDSNLVFS